ncbi:MAG: tRNA-dihydrouridine synthase family protein [Thermodesulfobacteriota bacterium]
MPPTQPPTLPFGPHAPWLAPLAGFSDLAFRLLCREHGAACACTEMVSAKGLVYGSPGTWPLLATTPEDAPLAVQVFGSELSFLEEAMRILLDRGFAWFDLNAGCPVKKVVKTGAGAALLKEPATLVRLAEAMARLAGEGRVGVKTRVSWGAGPETVLDLARPLEDAGVGWLTLHPRTAAQGFSGRADHTALARLKAATRLPVLASGDLFTAEDAAACLAATGADGVMFARGALSDPTVFGRLADLAAGRPPRPRPDLSGLILRHAALAREHLPGREALLKMRTIVPRYVKGHSGARTLRKELASCMTWEHLERLVNEHLSPASPPDGE